MKKIMMVRVAVIMPLAVAAQEMGTGEFEREQIQKSRPEEMKQSEPYRPRSPELKLPHDKEQQEAVLFYWSARGNVKEVKKLLKQGVNPDARDARGNTPLHHARNLRTIKLLVDFGADVNAQNDEGIARLHMDVVSGHIILVHYLTNKGADVNLATKQGITPLHLATRISYLTDVNLKPEKLLIATGASTSVLSLIIFSSSVQFMTLNAARSLIKTGIAAGTHGVVEAGALQYVITHGQTMSQFLKAYWKPLVASPYAPAFITAVTIIIATIITIDIVIRTDIVIQLLGAGADPNARDADGNTPLHTLAMGRLLKPKDRRGGVFIARDLILQGADTTIKNNAGQTPYDVAREYKRYPLALVLYPDKAQTVKQKVREALEYIKKTPAAQRTIEATEEHVIEPAQKAGKKAKRHAELLRKQAREHRKLLQRIREEDDSN